MVKSSATATFMGADAHHVVERIVRKAINEMSQLDGTVNTCRNLVYPEQVRRQIYLPSKLKMSRSALVAIPLQHMEGTTPINDLHLPAPSGDVTFERFLGKGGFGTVYQARVAGQVRAIKLAHSLFEGGWAHGAQCTEQIWKPVGGQLSEVIQCMHVGSHPHVTAIHGIRLIEGRLALVYEFVDGWTLHEAVDRAPRADHPMWAQDVNSVKLTLDRSMALRAIRDCAVGLSACQAHGVLHLDFKPSNVMIERSTGCAKVIDFGISQFAHDAAQAQLAYTPHFTAPERLLQNRAHKRSDVFSWAMTTLFVLRAIKIPEWNERNLPSTEAVASAIPRWVSPALNVMIRRGCSIDPSSRPPIREVEAMANEESPPSDTISASAATDWRDMEKFLDELLLRDSPS